MELLTDNMTMPVKGLDPNEIVPTGYGWSPEHKVFRKRFKNAMALMGLKSVEEYATILGYKTVKAYRRSPGRLRKMAGAILIAENVFVLVSNMGDAQKDRIRKTIVK